MKSTEEIKKYLSMDTLKLESELKDLQKKHIEYSLKVKAGKLDNFSLVRKTRKEIARLQSIISGKNLE